MHVAKLGFNSGTNEGEVGKMFAQLLLDVVLSLFHMMPLQCTVRQVAIMDYSQAHVGYDFSDGHVPEALAELRKPWCPTTMADPIVVD